MLASGKLSDSVTFVREGKVPAHVEQGKAMQVGELKSTLTEIDKPAQLRLTLTTGIIITIITYGYTPTGHRKAKRTSSSVSPWMTRRERD